MKVLQDVLGRVTKNKLRAQKKEMTAKKLKKKALKNANKKQKGKRMAALQAAADKFWASKPATPKQDEKEIGVELKAYCIDPTTLKTEKAECEHIEPLGSMLAKP